MEKLNINFKWTDNIIKTLCWIFSLISWLLYLISGYISLFRNDYNIWMIPKNIKIFNYYPYMPTQIFEPFIYIIIIFTLSVSLVGFCFFMIYSICIKSNTAFNGIMRKFSRFHFFPLICASSLFIIGEIFNNSKNQKNLLIISLIISILGLISLILIYFKTNIEIYYVTLFIKKGTFSCLIALFTYNIFYIILQIGIINEIHSIYIKDFLRYIWDGKREILSFINNCGTILPIAIGIVNIGLSFVLKDIMLAFMNLLIFIGCIIYYYNVGSNTKKFFKNYIDGIIYIIMITLSILAIGFLILIYKTSVLK